MVVDGPTGGGPSFYDSPNVTGVGLSGLAIMGGDSPGAIWNQGGSTLTVSDCSIGGSAGIYNEGTVTVTNCAIDNSDPGIDNYGTTTISDSTMTGNQTFGQNGGAIYNDGELTITSTTLTGNVVGGGSSGGAIESDGGSVTITGSAISDNDDDVGGGAGIENDAGTMNIVDTTVSGNNNEGGSAGGGVDNNGTMSVTDSTVSSNAKGGISNGGTLSVTDSTLSHNGGGGTGDGIYNAGSLEVTASTLAQNGNVDGAIENHGGSATVAASVLEGSPACSGAIIDAGYNLDGGASCGFAVTNHSISDVNPRLGPLQDNGGPTETDEPAHGSPLLDVIPQGATGNNMKLCPSTDQRGVARPQGSECDIGAVELSPTPQDITSADGVTATAGQPFSFTITTTGSPTPRIHEAGTPFQNFAFTDNGDGTGTISGKTKKVGSYKLLIKATFGSGSTKYVVLQVLTLTVSAG